MSGKLRRFCVAMLLASSLGGAVASAQPTRPDVQAMRDRVDALLAERWHAESAVPAELATDAEFLRRACLDLVGVTPKVGDVRAFLDDPRPDKRLRLVDRLLDNPGHVSHSAATWRRILLEAANSPQLDYFPSLENWLQNKLTANAPYDEIVRELILAEGNIQRSGPALSYAAVGNRPEEMAATTARVFLGVQLECAQCHDHPFDDWRQKDFWGYAAFFARVGPQQPQLVGNVATQAAGEVMIPNTTEPVKPMYLRGDWADPTQDANRRLLLARWLTSPDNPYLAKAAVNRVWANLFGRGLIDPVDDLKATNPASHPQLLEELSQYFIASSFDLWQLHRVLAGTRAYQLSSVPTSGNAPPALFASMEIKNLTPEQLYDSLTTAGLQVRTNNVNSPRQAFLNSFRGPPGKVSDYTAGIPQALTLMNGNLTNGIASAGSPLMQALAAPFLTDADRIDTLYLATVSRLPDDTERAEGLSLLSSAGAGERQQVLANILWALLNSAEFTFNH